MSRPEVTMLRAHGNPPESIFTGWLGPPNCSDGPPSTERTTIIRANPSRPALRNQTRLSGKAQILAQEKHRDDLRKLDGRGESKGAGVKISRFVFRYVLLALCRPKSQLRKQRPEHVTRLAHVEVHRARVGRAAHSDGTVEQAELEGRKHVTQVHVASLRRIGGRPCARRPAGRCDSLTRVKKWVGARRYAPPPPPSPY